MPLSRRRFIGVTLGAAAGGAAGAYGGSFLGGLAAEIDRPIRPPRGPETYALSICRLCPGGCGVRTRCIGGRPVKMEGNPLHPISGGRLCPKGQASLQSLFHPDRLTAPLRRVGPRGSLDSFRPATWEEAMSEIAVRLSLLRRQQRPEALALLRGPSRGVDARLASRFLEAFGSPNDVQLLRGDEAAAQALRVTQGVRAVPAYDLQHAEYALVLGGALLEASGSPVHAMRAYGEFRQGRPGRRGKLVHVGTRRSVTCAVADAWVPVRPGTEGILALGLASVLVAEELYDKDFVHEHTRQFDDYEDANGRTRPGLRTLLLSGFRLERVSGETGVPVNSILQISREFAASRPSVAIGPRAGPLLPGQLFDHLAAHVLNALVGNIDSPGGVLVPETTPLPPWPPLADDDVAAGGRARPRLDGAGTEGAHLQASDPEVMAEAFFSRSPYGTEALIVLDADPASCSMAPDSFTAALEQVPLVVSLAGIPNDTCLFADWILPLTHPLSSWDLELAPPGVPFPLASLARPVRRDTVTDARQGGDVVLDLARRIGGSVAEALPWPDVRALIRRETDGLYDARRGAVIGTDFDEAWIRLMERAGWWAPGYRSKDELWARIQETGGWWDPFYDHWHWNRVFGTEAQRFEFRPDLLSVLAEKRSNRIRAHGDEEQRQAPADRSLALELFEPLALSAGIGAELPFLQEVLDPSRDERWETWAEIHPETARALDVHDRDIVRVTSPHGSLRVRARVSDQVVPGLVALPVGMGKRAGGRWAEGRGANPLRLLSPVREAVSGLPDLGATRVRVVAEGRTSSDRAREG